MSTGMLIGSRGQVAWHWLPAAARLGSLRLRLLVTLRDAYLPVRVLHGDFQHLTQIVSRHGRDWRLNEAADAAFGGTVCG